MDTGSLDRREFLAATGAGIAGLAVGADSRADQKTGGKTIRCGFVGVGGRGTALLRATLEVEGVELVAICDTDAAARTRASELVEKVRAERPVQFEDWKKLLERDDITTVVSALPCDLHFANYRDTLAAGKHLYGEKPMCLTVEHADALVKQSASAGTMFQIGFQRRFSPQLRAGVKLFQDGVVGQPFDGRGVRFGTGGPRRHAGRTAGAQGRRRAARRHDGRRARRQNVSAV